MSTSHVMMDWKGVVDAAAAFLLANETWLEEDLRAVETLASDSDDIIGKLAFFPCWSSLMFPSSQCPSPRQRKQVSFHITDNFTFGSGGECTTALNQQKQLGAPQ